MSAARFLAAAACALATAFTALTAGAAECPADAGDCLAIAVTGTTAASIDLVILGDGYTTAQRDQFFQDAQTAANGMLSSETYGDYKAVFNVWAIFTPSNESGADDPSAGKLVDTAFDASYDTSGIDYLLAVNYVKVLGELNTRFPEKDLALCLVNAKAYGGSGGPIAVVSLDNQSLEIVRHELGHTLADLADEYTEPYPGFPDGDPEPNVASAAHLDPVKWEQWLAPGVSIPTPISDKTGPHEPIGAYEGARYKTTGVFRPSPTCLMRTLDVTFCPVCAEAMAKQFSALSLLIDAPSPASPVTIPAEGTSTFTATIPALSNLTFTWTVDGEMVAGADKSFGLDPSALGLADGAHQLGLTVYDATPLVRDDPDGVMKETFTWEITVDKDLPAASSGNGGGGGTGGGGGGSGDEPTCNCRTVGGAHEPPSGWLLLGLVPLAQALRRRRRAP